MIPNLVITCYCYSIKYAIMAESEIFIICLGFRNHILQRNSTLYMRSHLTIDYLTYTRHRKHIAQRHFSCLFKYTVFSCRGVCNKRNKNCLVRFSCMVCPTDGIVNGPKKKLAAIRFQLP